jgi:hypothetical protein
VIYKPKSGRYVGYKGSDYSESSITAFIDDILGGNGRFLNMKEELNMNEEKMK